MYASGAGGWGSLLTLQPDGSFTGDYRDSEMGANAPEYPNGSCYVSIFEGHFTDIQQISDYAWSMKLGALTTERIPEETWIADGVRYIAAEAAGVAGGEEFILLHPEHQQMKSRQSAATGGRTPISGAVARLNSLRAGVSAI